MPVDRLLHPRIGDSQKIAILTDLEFRVWITYLLAADDFGVMPFHAAKIQGACRALAHKPRKALERVLQRFVDCGLVREFTMDGARHIYSPTWQGHQKIKYPRRDTHYPAPPVDLLEQCPEATRELFATFHKGVPETFVERYADVPMLTRVRARETAIATGNWQTAKEGMQGESGKPHPIRDFLALHERLFEQRVGQRPGKYTGKEIKISERVLERHGEPEARRLLEEFMASRDEFVQRAGFGLNVFESQINKLLTARTVKPSQVGNSANTVLDTLLGESHERIA